MRIVLDECTPRTLLRHLPNHNVTTVGDLGLTSVKNGALLAALKDHCDVFLSVDRSIPKQHRLGQHPYAIVVMLAPSNRLADLMPLVPELLIALPNLKPGQVLTLGDRPRSQPQTQRQR